MTWNKAKVGEYWTSGPYIICTYRMVGTTLPESGYRVAYNMQVISQVPTLAEAKTAAVVHAAHSVYGRKPDGR